MAVGVPRSSAVYNAVTGGPTYQEIFLGSDLRIENHTETSCCCIADQHYPANPQILLPNNR